MSLVSAIPSDAPVELDAATLVWLKECPDPLGVARALGRAVWLNTEGQCHTCGESFLNKYMRHDVGGTYWESGELICKDCWYGYDSGTAYKPDFRAPPWPEHYVSLEEGPGSPLVNGLLRDNATGQVVGTVKGYNPNIAYARRVERVGMPLDAEAGSINLALESVTDTEPCEQHTTSLGTALALRLLSQSV